MTGRLGCGWWLIRLIWFWDSQEAYLLAEQQAQYAAAQEPPPTSTAEVAATPTAAIVTADASANAVPTAVETAVIDEGPAPAKREASAPPDEPVAKKAKVEDAPVSAVATPSVPEPVSTPAASVAPATQPQPAASTSQATETQSRDREHSTVFVVGPTGCGMTDAALTALFKDCGAIREHKIKLFEAEGKEVGLVEFVEAESVLAARTRDKKRFPQSRDELNVFPGVGSCLYVTNFPEDYDKETLEGHFKPVSRDCRVVVSWLRQSG